MSNDELYQQCIDVLVDNDRGSHTIPAPGLYPHQWLWDSCFIAIGQRHYDVARAQQELLSLLRGQWHNGMIPNMILSRDFVGKQSASFWQSNLSPQSPDNYATSGITQPPMLAEAVVRVGEMLSKNERQLWYKKMFPGLLAFHKWLYSERDFDGSGLISLVHPWESGLDNTPPWMSEIHAHGMPLWIKLVRLTKSDTILTHLRSDRKLALPGERLSTIDGLLLYSLQRKLRRHHYKITNKKNPTGIAFADISFNSIFIRANGLLREIAKTLNRPLPEKLLSKMQNTENSLEQLWDPYTGQYYSKDTISNQLIKISTIGSVLSLYSGVISKERAKELVKLLGSKHLFNTDYPVPSVPVNSSWFKEKTYWQGPTWINTNWLIIDGLRRYGYQAEANNLQSKTIDLVAKSGINEYFSPINGDSAGAKNFSWTASLTIDLLARDMTPLAIKPKSKPPQGITHS